jgi:hypothetical protein
VRAKEERKSDKTERGRGGIFTFKISFPKCIACANSQHQSGVYETYLFCFPLFLFFLNKRKEGKKDKKRKRIFPQ